MVIRRVIYFAVDLLVRLHRALDELGLARVGPVVVLPTLETPTQDLGHRGEVVGADNRLDLEAPVFGRTWLAVDEYDHAGDGAGALDVGIVVALDSPRVGRQVELFLQLRQGLVAL